MASDDEPIRCQLDMDADGAVTVTLLDGCGLEDAVDMCQIVLGRDEVTRRILVRPARSA